MSSQPKTALLTTITGFIAVIILAVCLLLIFSPGPKVTNSTISNTNASHCQNASNEYSPSNENGSR